MSEREKEIMKTIARALPKMSDYEKGYMIGVAETRADIAEKNRKEKEHSEELKAV